MPFMTDQQKRIAQVIRHKRDLWEDEKSQKLLDDLTMDLSNELGM